MFAAYGPISVAAGGSIEFEVRRADAQTFADSYGNILIRRQGLYYAAVTADIPKDACVDTVMRLGLDGADALLELAVTSDGGCAANFTGHAVFHAKPGALLKLTTLNDLCVSCGGRPVFTLTLIKIR